MRLYNFKCSSCGNVFEKLAGSKHEKVFCPRCRSGNVERRSINRIKINPSSIGTRPPKSSCGT